MKVVSREELAGILAGKHTDLSFRETLFEDMDLSGFHFPGVDLTLCSFRNVCLNGADFSGAVVENALFDGCPLRGAVFRDASMRTASLSREGSDPWLQEVCERPVSTASDPGRRETDFGNPAVLPVQ